MEMIIIAIVIYLCLGVLTGIYENMDEPLEFPEWVACILLWPLVVLSEIRDS